MSICTSTSKRVLPKLSRFIPLVQGEKFCHSDFEPSVKKGLILGAYSDDKGKPILTKAAGKFNDHIGGKLWKYIQEYGPEIRKGCGKILNNIDQDYWSVAVVGLGPKKQGYNPVEAIDEDRESVRVAAGIGATFLQKNGCHCLCVDGLGYPEQAAEGSALSIWRYQENKAKEHRVTVPQLELFEDSDQDSWQRGLFKAESQNFVRKLCDTPANQLTPLDMAQTAINELCPCGIKVEVHEKDWIEQQRMNSILTVSKGSCQAPYFVEINYCGGPGTQKPILLVGKGVTYDTGGLCMRPCAGMAEHRGDMAGAAIIMSVIRACSALSLPINVVGLMPLCENMPNGMKVGDVIVALNGKNIRITDTDNDGRLLMAEAICFGQEKYKPRLVIDIATETTGIVAALGSAASGIFSNSHTMWKQVRKAGVLTGDRVWRMPLWKYYTKNVSKLRHIDVDNKGVGKGSPCLAAAFLKEFILCVDWIHFDIEGVGMQNKGKCMRYYKRGRMTGRPTRVLIQLMYQLACPDGTPDIKE